MKQKIQIVSYFLIIKSFIIINAYCLETIIHNGSYELNDNTNIISIKYDNKKSIIGENDKIHNLFDVLMQFYPYAVISGVDTICSGDTAYLSVNLIQGTPPWRFTYSINGKKGITISGINEREYKLLAVKEGTYKLTAVRDVYRSGIVSGEGKIVFHQKPSAVLSGGGTICQGTFATLRVDLTGTPPFMIKYKNNYSGSGTVNNILSSPGFFGVSEAGNYTLTEISDKYCDGTFSGTASVSVLPSPDVSIEGLGTTYSVNSDPVPVFGNPDGGIFTGEGLIISNDTIFFLPSWAGTENSPHKIQYSYQDPGNGCNGKDSVMVNVLDAQADIIFPENKMLYCFDDSPFSIRGLNVNNITGNFVISGDEGLTDNGDNTATIDPSELADGEYEVTYRYYDDTWFEYSESFEIEYVNPVWFVGFERNSFCNNEDAVALNGNMEEGMFHGNGVTGNIGSGFFFWPTSIDKALDTIFYTYTTENGCSRQVFEVITISSAPQIDFSLIDSCLTYEAEDSTIFFNKTISSDNILIWSWNFDDIGSGQANFSNLKNPKHHYTAGGTKYVMLSATTDKGCTGSEELRVNLGDRPHAKFSWNTECYQVDNPILFTNQSTTEIGSLEKFTWQIQSNEDFETYNSENLSYAFPNPGNYNVIYKVESNYGCSDSVIIPFALRPVIDIADHAYFEDFETGMNGWGTMITTGEDSISWRFGASDNDFPEAISGLYYWYTSINQGIKENSWIVSPCFDFANSIGPMIKFDAFRSFDQNRDGIVMQYSDNNGKSWYNIGDLNDGINWYNAYDILGLPGGQSIGWSYIKDNIWNEMRHNLDSLEKRSLVQFRIAYGSEGTYSNNKGFAFDNVWIGEREKVVLLEHFTNSSDTLSKNANDIITDVIGSFKKDVINLQYHTSFPGEDPFNSDNPIVPEVRVYYYGILSVPYSLLDGGTKKYDYYLKDLEKRDIILQSLKDPILRLDVQTVYHASDVDIDVIVEAKDLIPLLELTLHIAIIENEISGIEGKNGETKFMDVVKAFVPDPAGTYIYREWSPGDFETFYYTWTYDKVFDTAQLRVVAFVQNENSKEIYQAAIDKFDITSEVSEEPLKNQEILFEVIPNPVTDNLQIRFRQPLEYPCYLSICGMDGRMVSNDFIKAGTEIHRIDVTSFASGLYVINIFSVKEFMKSQRIMVNHLQQ
jgi:hypothetical protein